MESCKILFEYCGYPITRYADGRSAAIASLFKTIDIVKLGGWYDFTFNIFEVLAWAWYVNTETTKLADTYAKSIQHRTEMWFVIIFGSIPVLRHLLKEIIGRIGSHFSWGPGPNQASCLERGEAFQWSLPQNTCRCQTQARPNKNALGDESSGSQDAVLPNPNHILVRQTAMVESYEMDEEAFIPYRKALPSAWRRTGLGRTGYAVWS